MKQQTFSIKKYSLPPITNIPFIMHWNKECTGKNGQEESPKACVMVIYMHKQKMAHRDIKPGNIMLKDANTPIIIDFGLCDTKHPYNGTSDYLAPE